MRRGLSGFVTVVHCVALASGVLACKGGASGGDDRPPPPMGVASSGAASSSASSPNAAAARVVAVTADAKGFTPSSASFNKGDRAQLVFTRTTDETCAKEVVFPELKIRRPLPLNEPVAVELQTSADHTYRFQCGMAMWEGSVVVK